MKNYNRYLEFDVESAKKTHERILQMKAEDKRVLNALYGKDAKPFVLTIYKHLLLLKLKNRVFKWNLKTFARRLWKMYVFTCFCFIVAMGIVYTYGTGNSYTAFVLASMPVIIHMSYCLGSH